MSSKLIEIDRAIQEVKVHRKILTRQWSELNRQNKIDGASYGIRKGNLKRLNNLVEQLETRRKRMQNMSQHLSSEGTIHMFDGFISPIEGKVWASFLKWRSKLLAKLMSEVDRVVHWAQETCSGGSTPFKVTYRLSRMRRSISRMDKELEEIRIEKDDAKALISSLLHISSNNQQMTFNILTTRLKEHLGRIKKKLVGFYHQREHFKNLTDQVTWMQNWLEFQERQLSFYQPRFDLPDETDLEKIVQRHENYMRKSKKEGKKTDG